MSSTLSLNASNIAITDLVVEPGSVISQASQTVKLRVDLTATPSGASSATMVGHKTFCSEASLETPARRPSPVLPSQT